MPRVQALKDQVLNGIKVRAGAVMAVGKRHADKLVREGLARVLEDPQKRMETK